MPAASVPDPTRSTEIARLELSRLAPDASLDHIFARACELSAEALAVERVGVWLFIDDHTAIRCADLYERSKDDHSSGVVLHVADAPIYFAALKKRKTVAAESALTEGWTAELAGYLAPLGIGAMLDAGIFVEGKLLGIVCHEHVGKSREWTTEARDFAGSVADLLALKIQSAQVRDLRAAFLTQRERLAGQDKNSALEALAGGIAHDFRNLLGVVLGHGELLSTRRDLPADVREQGRRILDAAERGIALAGELIEFSRPIDRPPTVIDLGEVTAEFLPVLQSAVGRHHSPRFIKPSALGQVLMNRTQYTRLLLNLVVNARDAMPDSGPIDIRLRPVKLTGNPSYSGRFILLEVQDHGTGMDEATQRRAFEPFFSTKSKGTGLGLAIVGQVLDRVGGLVRIESVGGKGTTIRVFFPRIGPSSGETTVFVVPPELRAEG